MHPSSEDQPSCPADDCLRAPSNEDDELPLTERYSRQTAFAMTRRDSARRDDELLGGSANKRERSDFDFGDDQPVTRSAAATSSTFSTVPKANDIELQSQGMNFSSRVVTASCRALKRTRLFDSGNGSMGSRVAGLGSLVLPRSLESLLLTHQKDGVRFLLDSVVLRGHGGMLADYMGLGKTLQVLTLCSLLLGTRELKARCFANLDRSAAAQRHRAERTSTRPVAVPSLRRRPLRLVVVSPSGVTPQWVDEALRFSDALRLPGDGPEASSEGVAHTFVRFEESWLRDDATATLASLPHPLPPLSSWVFCLHSDTHRKAVLMDVFHRCGGLLCISYSQIVLDACRHAEVDVICLDEGHKIKNQNTVISQWMYALRTPLRIIITGFPLQNRLTELYQLLMYVSCGAVANSLGSSVAFQRHFADPLHQSMGIGQQRHRSLFEGIVCDTLRRSPAWCERRAAAFHSLTRAYILRRGLPVLRSLVGQQRHVFYVSVRPSMIQLLVYNKTKASVTSPLDLLIMSSEVSNLHPASWRSSFKTHLPPPQGAPGEAAHAVDDVTPPNTDEESNAMTFSHCSVAAADCELEAYVAPKMIFLWTAAIALRKLGRKLIAFSQFHSVLDEVPLAFARMAARQTDDAISLRVARCDGTMPVEDRVDTCKRFNSQNMSGPEGDDATIDVLLFSLKAGCEGLNLIGGSMVVSLDVSFNPASEHESFARAYRLGQSTAVDIVVLTMANSCEDDRLQLQDGKSRLVDNCLDATATPTRPAGAPGDTPPAPRWWRALPDLEESSAVATRFCCGSSLDPAAAAVEAARVTGMSDVPIESYVANVLPYCAPFVHSVTCMDDGACPMVEDASCDAEGALWRDGGSSRDRYAQLVEVGLQELAYEKVNGYHPPGGAAPQAQPLFLPANDNPPYPSEFEFTDDMTMSSPAAQARVLPALTYFSNEGPRESRCDVTLATTTAAPLMGDDEFGFDGY